MGPEVFQSSYVLFQSSYVSEPPQWARVAYCTLPLLFVSELPCGSRAPVYYGRVLKEEGRVVGKEVWGPPQKTGLTFWVKLTKKKKPGVSDLLLAKCVQTLLLWYRTWRLGPNLGHLNMCFPATWICIFPPIRTQSGGGAAFLAVTLGKLNTWSPSPTDSEHPPPFLGVPRLILRRKSQIFDSSTIKILQKTIEKRSQQPNFGGPRAPPLLPKFRIESWIFHSKYCKHQNITLNT